MDSIKRLFTAKATCTGGRNGRTAAEDGSVAANLSVPRDSHATRNNVPVELKVTGA